MAYNNTSFLGGSGKFFDGEVFRRGGLDRRDFLKALSLGAAGVTLATTAKPARAGMGQRHKISIDKPLRVKPVLVYHLYKKYEKSTWRQWGGIHNESDVKEEIARINKELARMKAESDFPLEFERVSRVNSDEAAGSAVKSDCDVYLVYAAGAGGPGLYSFKWLYQLVDTGKPNVMFLRHKSGPVSLLYETAHPYFLRKGKDKIMTEKIGLDDIVVDDCGKVLWRLRALNGLKNTKGAKIVAVGGPGSAGLPHECPDSARDIWKLDIITLEDKAFKGYITKAHADKALLGSAKQQMKKYLKHGVVDVRTKEEYILNSFVLADVMKQIMAENGAGAITIRNCMSYGKIAKTSPCLAFSMINDSGLMAFCESDFSVIPAGMLLCNISGRPVFISDPCFPHDGVCTSAHCSCTRRLDGENLEPVRIFTHHESDFGAAPKVLFSKGQKITNIASSFAATEWMGFTGDILDHPDFSICRSQFDCSIDGDWEKLLTDMRGFHWITCYGDYLNELGYAAGKIGIEWKTIV